MLLEGIALDSPRLSLENEDLDWSFLSIPSNLFKVHLIDANATVSSVDTDHEDEVFDDDFDTNIRNQDLIIRKQIQSLDKPEKNQVQLVLHTGLLHILYESQDIGKENVKKGFSLNWIRWFKKITTSF